MFEPVRFDFFDMVVSLIPPLAMIVIIVFLIVLYRKSELRQRTMQKQLQDLEEQQKQIIQELQKLRQEKDRSN